MRVKPRLYRTKLVRVNKERMEYLIFFGIVFGIPLLLLPVLINFGKSIAEGLCDDQEEKTRDYILKRYGQDIWKE